MKIANVIILILFLSCSSKEVSEEARSLKENAITFKNLSKLNHKVYNEISNYDIIMVGEMHGTKEPSEFVYGLCNKITENEKGVILGLEIPPSQMENFSDDMPLEQLKELTFFTQENTHGMNGKAWLDLIAKCNQNSKVTVKFIDNWRNTTRDFSMYLEVLDIKKNYPHTKIVTLTGNVHNWLKPYNNEVKLGGYLMNDTINFESKNIMSINHIYSYGTMFNRINGELKEKTIKKTENIFNTSISSKLYLCNRINEKEKQNTHFLYTDKVTHSEKIEKR